MKIKYSIRSRGEMLIEVNDKILRVTGELTFVPPVFYANISSMNHWEFPFADEYLSEEEKNEIIKKVSELSKNSGTEIYFD